MRVQVQLFAAAKDRARTDLAEFELNESDTVGDIRTRLVSEFPELAPIAAHLLFAINEDYATVSSPIVANARIACFPPVSGG